MLVVVILQERARNTRASSACCALHCVCVCIRKRAIVLCVVRAPYARVYCQSLYLQFTIH